jgi:hypothetical protein
MDQTAYKKQAWRWSLAYLVFCSLLFAVEGFRHESLFVVILGILILPIGGWLVRRTIKNVDNAN